jgi:hypothetical protein
VVAHPKHHHIIAGAWKIEMVIPNELKKSLPKFVRHLFVLPRNKSGSHFDKYGILVKEYI